VQLGVPGIEQRKCRRRLPGPDGPQHLPRCRVAVAGDERAMRDERGPMALVQDPVAARGVPGRWQHALGDQVAHQLGRHPSGARDVDGPHTPPPRVEASRPMSWAGIDAKLHRNFNDTVEPCEHAN
jgi:hypothetical protein